MQLVADRFVTTGSDHAIDLATGESVYLVVTSAGGGTEQARWAGRCDTLHKLHHHAIASLVDYGALRETKRFEAWQCGPLWRGAAAERQRVVDSASLFFRACDLSTNDDMAGLVHQRGTRAVVRPGTETGYPTTVASEENRFGEVGGCGLVRLDRPAVAAIAELFDRAPNRRPQIVALWGPRGSGKTSATRELARHARLKGYVPMAISMTQSRAADLVRGRTMLLIDDEPASGWRPFINVCIRNPRAHVLVLAGSDDVRGAVGVALDRVGDDAMFGAVRPFGIDPRLEDRIRRAIKRSDGVPGRFVGYLWGEHAGADSIAIRSCRAAEGAPTYGDEQSVETGDSSSDVVRSISAVAQSASACAQSASAAAPSATADCRRRLTDGQSADCWKSNDSWSEASTIERPERDEVAALRRHLDLGLERLRNGRHAPGDRAIRQAVGGLARRGEWEAAARGAVGLARSLIKRGRTRDGQATLEVAREYAHRVRDETVLLDIAVLAGTAWTQLARFDEAEAVLGGALAAATAGRNRAHETEIAVALARALFWRGAYADAERVIGSQANGEHTDSLQIRVGTIGARIAVGMHEFGKAAAQLSTAVQSALRVGDQALIAETSSAAAFVHLAIGDLGNVERDSAMAVAAARSARDPLRAICARLTLAECVRRSGRRGETVRVLERFNGKRASTLPPLIRARWQLQRDLTAVAASWSSAATDIAARHATTTGIGALRLFAPLPGNVRAVAGVLDEVIDILHVCHTADEESAILKAVCVRLQRQLLAASVAFFGAGAAEPVPVVFEGGRIEPAIAARAVTSGITIDPHRCEEKIGAAAPVRYGGCVIGAIAARWTLGTFPDPTRTSTVLTMAAAAAAPALSGVLARRARSGGAGLELVGVSRAIAEIRRAIERAAAAPFAVLIDGESGCGKELVARAVHRHSARRDRPICTLNCAALPDDLVESELFGHARGAFTGAVAERTGVFEEAHAGTVFLDEVGELSPRAQAKVLRVIQEGELRRIGENVSRRVDVRIVAATNRNLQQEVAAGRFRLDLLYRLDVIRISLPPLRDRREDIALLVEHFWREATSRVGSRATLSAAAIAALVHYDWPGNVRELQNVLAALAVRAGKRGVVPPTALPAQFGAASACDSLRLEDARRQFEERFVRAALVRTGGRRAKAAAELGLTRQGLTKLMTRLGIDHVGIRDSG